MIVILNDNEMSIAPNVGAMSKYMNRVRTDPRYTQAKARWSRTCSMCRWAAALLGIGRRLQELGQGVGHPHDDLGRAGLRLCRPGGRAQHRRIGRDAGSGQGHAAPGLHPCDHHEGQGLRSVGGRQPEVARRRAAGQAGRAQSDGAQVPGCVRRHADPHRPGRQARGGDHGGHARRHQPEQVRQGLPGAHVRRGHRRAARRDVRGGPGRRGHAPGRAPSTARSCSAPSIR